jgi:hypothetical protein
MKYFLYSILMITLFGCSNDKVPSDWAVIERSNVSGIGKATIKLKHPTCWIENENAKTAIFTKYLLAFPDTSQPNITINATFPVSVSTSFDEFVDGLVIPTYNGQNKKSIMVNTYKGYSIDVPLPDGRIAKSYIVDNGKNPIIIFVNANNNELYDKKIAQADSIVNTLVIE